jgi:cell division protein FtsQ
MNRPVKQLPGEGPVLPRRAPHMSQSTRWIISLAGITLLLGAAVVLTRLAMDPVRFPVSNVDILGTVDYIDRNGLTAAVGEHLKYGFYGLDIDEVRESVERLPWVALARVSRVWPGRIEVRVEEHEPGARWNDDQLLSKRLELFTPPQLRLDNPRYLEWREVFAGLPQIRGVDGRHGELLDAYRAYAHEISRIRLSLEVLDEDDRGSQSLVLSNQVRIRLGYDDQELRLQRFLDVYERMAAEILPQGSLSQASFDMRYSNGFALGGVTADASGVKPRGEVNGRAERLLQGSL